MKLKNTVHKLLAAIVLPACLELVSQAEAALQISQVNSPQLWQRSEFQITGVPTGFNPFDPDSIRVDAAISFPSGRQMTVPAFWCQEYTRRLEGSGEQLTASGAPDRRLRFTPTETGNYSVTISVFTNDQFYASSAASGFTVPAVALPARYGYVGIASNGQYFATSNGNGLPLKGENLGWAGNAGTYDYDKWLTSMQSVGENFARVWMCPWNFAIEQTADSRTNYSLPSAWQLDHVLQFAETNGIYLQLCLDFHGMLQIVPDSFGGNNFWPKNPYNTANGGPCAMPDAFFTNSAAKSLYQKRLRYLIARYGYSQNLLAWEFFNEIDNDFAWLNKNDVIAWHNFMGGWLHTNDPFGHLVTSSRSSELPGVSQLDFISEHDYGLSDPSTNLAAQSTAFQKIYGKPVMIAEFGTDWTGWKPEADPYLRGFRQGIWGAALGGSVGTAMPWWWESIAGSDAYPVFASLSRILNHTSWGQGHWTNIGFNAAATMSVAVGLRGADESLVYVVAPGASWPAGATNASLPLQQSQTITMTNWPTGGYRADWYCPSNAAYVGSSQGVTTNGNLTLTFPNFSEDLAGVIFLTTTNRSKK